MTQIVFHKEDPVARKKKVREIIERAKAHVATEKTATKTAEPSPLPDPHGVRFTEAELDALCDTDNEASALLAMGKATPEIRAMLAADVVDHD